MKTFREAGLCVCKALPLGGFGWAITLSPIPMHLHQELPHVPLLND